MKYLLALLLTVSGAQAQAVWGNATFIVPTNWAALYGFVTNATGYPLLAWYQADNYTTNAGVATLPDSWTNAWHLTNVTEAAFPTSVAADLGGHQTIQFDGTDDYLNTVLYTNVQPSEVWLVMFLNATNGSTQQMLDSKTGGANRRQRLYVGTGILSMLAGAPAVTIIPIAYVVTNKWLFLHSTYAASASAVSTNGNARLSLLTGSEACDGLTLGQTYTGFSQGYFKLAELICYGNGFATPGTNTVARSNIWYYIKSKYGLR